ncbi:RxLR effector protein [Phytophthora megakarya]|uniref:RxLR effector protein n=1 Tax=Phytophthora megakarya TaxID=4795 RepID=A0A225UI14_9STRA|nr:RxLR effector protein [Phytophthora megakarya]
MRSYKNLLLAVVVLVALSSVTSAQDPVNQKTIRSLRTGTTDQEERGPLDWVRNEIAFLKLNRASKQTMTKEQKLANTQLASKNAKVAKNEKANNKVADQIKKLEDKQKELLRKQEDARLAQLARHEKKMEKVRKQEVAKANEILQKQDHQFNLWLVRRVEPKDVEAKFLSTFKTLEDQKISVVDSPAFKALEEYYKVFHRRYIVEKPNVLESLKKYKPDVYKDVEVPVVAAP